MRGILPGNTVNTSSLSGHSDEIEYLLDKKHKCPVCKKEFTCKIVKSGKIRMGGTDMDLRPKYISIDTMKYRVIECPSCGFADMDNTFDTVSEKEAIALLDKRIRFDVDYPFLEGVRNYPEAYRIYKAAIRSDLIRNAKKSKRAYTALCTAWLLRGWRETMEECGVEIEADAPMSKNEENKLIKYVIKNFREAEQTESFPLNGITEPTYDYLMAALSYNMNELKDAETYVMRALRSKELKSTIRTQAEDLRDIIRRSCNEGRGSREPVYDR